MSRPTAQILALRFALTTGSRAALRLILPPTAVITAALVYLGPDLMHALGKLLFSASGSWPALGIVVAVLFGGARFLQPRIELEQPFLCSLPLGRRQRARASLVALSVAQIPLLLIFSLLLLATLESPAGGLSFAFAARAAGLVLAPLPVAVAARSWRLDAMAPRCLGVVLGWAVAGALLSGLWLVQLGALVLMVPSLRVAGGRLLDTVEAHVPGRRGRGGARFELPFRARISLRALGWPRGVASVAGSGLAIGGAALFVNNNQLTERAVAGAWRLGVGVALAWLVTGLARELRLRRPWWAFERSLPASSAERVRSDAAFLVAWSLPLQLGGPFLLRGATPWMVLLSVYGALRGADTLRVRGERFAGSSGMVLLAELCGWAAFSALVPLPASVCLGVAVVLAWRSATERDRRLGGREEA